MTSTDFSRQSFLGPNSNEILAGLRVAIIGLGGGGSHIGQQLAHVGIGHYRLIDPDAIEASNLNRLIGATQIDVENKTPKVEIVRRTILGIRPRSEVIVAQKKWQEADYLIKDAHVIVGCIDGYRQREYLEGAARRFSIPYIDIGMDVASTSTQSFAIAGQMILSLPGRPCMRCIGFLTKDRLSQEENRYGHAGANPQVVWTNGTLASLAVGMLVRLFTPWCNSPNDYVWLELDGNAQTITPSVQPQYMLKSDHCEHHGGADGVGDPFFGLPAPNQHLKT